MKKRLILFLGAIIIVLGSFISLFIVKDYDIVIYGSGFSGCAAAYNAAQAAPEKKIALIVPEPVNVLGGLGTVGGQNFADIRFWQGKLVTQGSFLRWYEKHGQFYSAISLANSIEKELSQFPNLTIIYSQDIQSVNSWRNKISAVHLTPIYRGDNGVIKWGKDNKRISARVFIDASDDGRLARIAGQPLSVGRQDWPDKYLKEDEIDRKVAWQQAATLMFKVKNVNLPPKPGAYGEWYFSQDNKGSWCLVGGKNTWQNNPIVNEFNQINEENGFAIKPINAAQDGVNSDEWWVNMLLVFHVDGRAHERDRGSELYPSDVLSYHVSTDLAWTAARSVLSDPSFLNALHQFKVEKNGNDYGFGKAQLIKDQDGQPVVGQIMYIRETVHALQNDSDKIKENVDFAVTTQEASQAGKGPEDGKDKDHYSERIGLGYYLMDINAYEPDDLKKSGNYNWPVTGIVRSDWQKEFGQPVNPVYLPFNMLVSNKVNNLLLSGYAASCSSMAWAELRVLPNLAVLGDAAGVAAARAVLFKEDPVDFKEEQIKWIQERLKQYGARLDK